MAIKKFYSNKKKAGWRENPSHVPPEKIAKDKKQKDHQRRYYSWGYDIDLAPVQYSEDGTPLRNRRRESGFASQSQALAATGRIRLAEKKQPLRIKRSGDISASQRLISKKD